MKYAWNLFAALMMLTLVGVACGDPAAEPLMPEDLSVDQMESQLSRGAVRYCGCNDDDNDDCDIKDTKQWACSYGPPCNFVNYMPDCSMANQCPLTTWNGCALQFQDCRTTGYSCNGSCNDGRPCTLRYDGGDGNGDIDAYGGIGD